MSFDRELPDFPVAPRREVTENADKIVLAREVPNSARPGQTGVYRSVIYDGRLLTIDSDPLYPRTSYEVWNSGKKRDPKANCLGHRAWDPLTNDYANTITWETYEQVEERRTAIGSALVHFADTITKPETKEWCVGLWTVNRPEWQIVNQAINAYSLRTVSLYATLGPNVVEHCINHANVQIVFAAPQHIPTLLTLAKSCPGLKAIVCLDPFGAIDTKYGGPAVGSLPKATALKAWAAEKEIQLYDFLEFEALGRANLTMHRPPKPEDIASIYYTSGSTGMPKGVVLSHRFLATCNIAAAHGQEREDGENVQLSYLPLSHIYARFIEDGYFGVGGSITYSTGDITRLIEDFQIAKPHFLIAVPRVLNRLYSAISNKTIQAPGLKGALARKAFAAKLANLKSSGRLTHPLWDALVMRKVKQVVGGRLRLIGTGSAPLSPQVLQFLMVAFSCKFREGYGLTESGGVATMNCADDFTSAGKIGPPCPTTEIKLVDVPDLKYLASDKPEPRGEICLRGENIFTHYYKDETKTKEAIDSEGWFHTGDIGTVDSRGRFRIVDRVKNLYKLSQGEYVAVEKVENVYSSVSLAAQLFIYADSGQDHLVLFVVPEPDTFAAFASRVLGRSIVASDQQALAAAAQDKRVIDAALVTFNKEAKLQKLNGFETARQLAFHLTPFSVEDDTLTPTLKIKRNVATQKLKERADRLFAEYASAPAKGREAKL